MPDTSEPEDAVTADERSENLQTPANQPSSVPVEAPAAEKPAASAPPTTPKPEANPDSGFIVSAGKVDPEVIQKAQDEKTYYYEVLSLSDCELLEEKVVTDKFTYTIGPGTHVYTVSERTPFHDKGYCIVGIDTNANGVFLGVLHRDSSGNLLGRVYRVPNELRYENVHPEG